ncbi:MAG TPA: carbonate dehydratase [Burkholderiales bacterium]|jgi:carbonic anhydrase
MKFLQRLFDNNRAWAEAQRSQDSQFFRRLAAIQHPDYLWIGCSDSRVPANQITGLNPGEVFVHRNVANVVVHTDLNCLSVIQYAVDVLKVQHIIVCGHYGCGGVKSALDGDRLGLINNWLRHIEDVGDKHRAIIANQATAQARWDRLCELNVIEQVMQVCRTTIVQDAWARGQSLAVHGWIYGLDDGMLHDLGMSLQQPDEVEPSYAVAVDRLRAS